MTIAGLVVWVVGAIAVMATIGSEPWSPPWLKFAVAGIGIVYVTMGVMAHDRRR